jgi:hypothetical protein
MENKILQPNQLGSEEPLFEEIGPSPAHERAGKLRRIAERFGKNRQAEKIAAQKQQEAQERDATLRRKRHRRRMIKISGIVTGAVAYVITMTFLIYDTYKMNKQAEALEAFAAELKAATPDAYSKEDQQPRAIYDILVRLKALSSQAGSSETPGQYNRNIERSSDDAATMAIGSSLREESKSKNLNAIPTRDYTRLAFGSTRIVSYSDDLSALSIDPPRFTERGSR